MIEKQELYCHECGQYVQFDLDISLNGNHVLNCPVCNHEHCRVVENGIITDERWDSRNNNLPTFTVSPTVVTSSATSTYDTYSLNSRDTSAESTFLYSSWMTTTAVS